MKADYEQFLGVDVWRVPFVVSLGRLQFDRQVPM